MKKFILLLIVPFLSFGQITADDFSKSNVTVSLCYPSERIPNMMVYLINIFNQQVYDVMYVGDSTEEVIFNNIPPGSYVAIAHNFQMGNFFGAHTWYDPKSNEEHTLREFKHPENIEIIGKKLESNSFVEICYDWMGLGSDLKFKNGMNISDYINIINLKTITEYLLKYKY